MNKQRRKALNDAIEKLTELKEIIDSIREEEQDAYDNLPESLQDSEKGEQMYDNCDDLETAASDLEDVIDNLEDIAER